MRNVLTTASELAGAAIATYGLSLWCIPVALVFVGGCLIGIGFLLRPEADR